MGCALDAGVALSEGLHLPFVEADDDNKVYSARLSLKRTSIIYMTM